VSAAKLELVLCDVYKCRIDTCSLQSVDGAVAQRLRLDPSDPHGRQARTSRRKPISIGSFEEPGEIHGKTV